jgi:hypothetical protein
MACRQRKVFFLRPGTWRALAIFFDFSLDARYFSALFSAGGFPEKNLSPARASFFAAALFSFEQIY